MKKVLVIGTSPRTDGNSNALCQSALEGALAAGAGAEFIRTSDFDVHPCCACNACVKTGGVCAIKDDVPQILEKMGKADAIVMATPLYFHTLSAQIKMVIDRAYATYNTKPHSPLENKSWYLIVTAQTAVKEDLEVAVDSFKGFLRDVPGSVLKGVLYATGTSIEGPANADRYFGQARAMGMNAAR